jgi:uncharacterized tellurite resistance protein B-like protein
MDTSGLKSLEPKERLALVALLRELVVADRTASEEEAEGYAAVVEALGRDAYRSALDVADKRFELESDLKTFLQSIRRQEAREILYAIVMDVCMADSISPQEAPLLEWLAEVWKIRSKPAPS